MEVFKKFQELIPEIISIFDVRGDDSDIRVRQKGQWLFGLAFFTDVTCHLNSFNFKLIGKGKTIIKNQNCTIIYVNTCNYEFFQRPFSFRVMLAPSA